MIPIGTLCLVVGGPASLLGRPCRKIGDGSIEFLRDRHAHLGHRVNVIAIDPDEDLRTAEALDNIDAMSDELARFLRGQSHR